MNFVDAITLALNEIPYEFRNEIMLKASKSNDELSGKGYSFRKTTKSDSAIKIVERRLKFAKEKTLKEWLKDNLDLYMKLENNDFIFKGYIVSNNVRHEYTIAPSIGLFLTHESNLTRDTPF